jgi:DNA-binding PadR family transcriptional regulator
MESSDNRNEHSNVFHLGTAPEAEPDENSSRGGNLPSRHDERVRLSDEGKTAAIELLKRIEMLEQKIDELEEKDVRKSPKKKKIRRKAK